MQLGQCLVQAIHVIAHCERLKTSWQRLQYHINGKLIIEGSAQSLQALNVTNHLDYMRADRSAFSKLSTKQGLRGIKPVNPRLIFEHATQPHDHIVRVRALILLLQLRVHASKHQALHIHSIIGVLHISTICSGVVRDILRLIRVGRVKNVLFLFLPENDSQVSVPINKVCSI